MSVNLYNESGAQKPKFCHLTKYITSHATDDIGQYAAPNQLSKRFNPCAVIFLSQFQ